MMDPVPEQPELEPEPEQLPLPEPAPAPEREPEPEPSAEDNHSPPAASNPRPAASTPRPPTRPPHSPPAVVSLGGWVPPRSAPLGTVVGARGSDQVTSAKRRHIAAP